MTTFYNLILIILHTVGMLVIAVINTSKMVFFYDWYWQDDLYNAICAVGIFMLHYTLVFIGYKKGFLTPPCLKALQIIEFVLIGLQVLLWIMLNYMAWEAICPQICIYIAALLLRVCTLEKIREK